MVINRLKNTFTAGEISPLLSDRVDFKRQSAGCKSLLNMIALPQGPCTRRSGSGFIYDLGKLGQDPTKPQFREVPFVYSESQSYTLIFFWHTSGFVRVVFGSGNGLVLVGAGPAIYALDLIDTVSLVNWDIEGFDWAQNGNDLYCVQENYSPYIISRAAHDSWSLNLVAVTAAPVDWSAPNLWPQRVTLHQQRLVFACNNTDPQKTWLSKAGSVHDFTYGTADDDAFAYTLNSGSQNAINWISSGEMLFKGTIASEWSVSGSGNTTAALTPTNKLAQRRSNKGSTAEKPLNIDTVVLFLGGNGRSVYEFGGAGDYYGSYRASDLSVLAPHLTELNYIVDWTYQQVPHSVVWCVMNDGSMIALTYAKEHEVIGWHRHETREGDAVLAITSIPGETREDDVWAVVRRNIDGTDYFYVEKFADTFTSEAAIDGRFLDSYSVYDDVATDTLTHGVGGIDLEHLIGETVSVLADGTVHPDVVVSATASGTITLDGEYSLVVVGFNFTSEVRPFLSEIPSNDGATLGKRQRITEIRINFYRSLGVFYGRYNAEEDTELLEELAFRVPYDNMGEAVPLFSGVRIIDFPEGYDTSPEYFIRQTQPLPLTIKSVVDVVEVDI